MAATIHHVQFHRRHVCSNISLFIGHDDGIKSRGKISGGPFRVIFRSGYVLQRSTYVPYYSTHACNYALREKD